MEMALRRRFAALARDPKARRVGGIERPTRWYPERVPDPTSGLGMTGPAAWSFLAERLEDPDQEMESITLDKPPGAVGYVMKVRLDHGSKRLYVKFEFLAIAGSSVICGRSFHLEDPR